MKCHKIFFTLAVILSLALLTNPAFSQEESQPPAAKEAAQPEELSIYGEVQAVNQASNSLSVQYYDYDSDEEKTIEITLDKDTAIENAAKLDEIKQGNWVDVTYSVSGGKDVAKSIIVEKEEAPAEILPEEAPAGTPGEEF
ncbi:MAG: hypothetical protein HZC19_00810 [Candidatus Omnitrophica bacterium]|nr:hypothetical protein [Candidatus Omnitrophota bacterium]